MACASESPAENPSGRGAAYLLALHVPGGHEEGHVAVWEVPGQLLRPHQGPTRQETPLQVAPVERGPSQGGAGLRDAFGAHSGLRPCSARKPRFGRLSQSWGFPRAHGWAGGTARWSTVLLEHPPCSQFYKRQHVFNFSVTS